MTGYKKHPEAHICGGSGDPYRFFTGSFSETLCSFEKTLSRHILHQLQHSYFVVNVRRNLTDLAAVHTCLPFKNVWRIMSVEELKSYCDRVGVDGVLIKLCCIF